MATKEAREIVDRLKHLYPPIKTCLRHKNAFELLIATILSAQCTDKLVNMVTETLFKKHMTPEDFASANTKKLESVIRPTGYYHSKTKYIKEASNIIVSSFGSRVPDTMEGLLRLPGVGRKTTNIVLSVAYNKTEGIAVDTHVKRLSKRLGLTQSDNPDKIEEDLMAITPRALWNKIAILLILHGRNVCYARKPRCAECVLNDICPAAIFY